jgi:hypothetical protein
MQHISAFSFRITATLGLLVGLAGGLLAQQSVDIARQHLLETATKQSLTPADIQASLVSSAYKSPTTGWEHVYFNQAVEGVEVHNRVMSVVVVRGQVQYAVGNYLPGALTTPRLGDAKAAIAPLVALQAAALDAGFAPSATGQVQEVSAARLPNGSISRQTYRIPALSDGDVEVKLYWLPQEVAERPDKKRTKLQLAWQVRFLTKDGKTGWNIRVNATSGAVLEKQDDVLSCNFGTPQHTAGPHQCTQRPAGEATYFGLGKGVFAPNQYHVFDYPLEAPTFGSRSVVTNPYNRFAPAGTGPGTTNGWHSDGTTSYSTTQGNNVWAQEDVDNNNTGGSRPASATLDFNYAYTLGLNTAAANQNAAITNLFYWNNLIHDVLWRFGFDEPSGNFQTNNLGRGGSGNDHVQADAQDGSGTNNANFLTPTDGTSGRMQMFLWNIPSTYQADSDFDNAIIAHEYGHGWSIRLTGGPANSNCLNNAEQGGEGWSDYLGLMLTTNWGGLTPTVASANIPRGIGTYVLGQATTGAGIRPYRYSYDMANVNAPVTYAQVGNTAFSQPHGIGSIWCTMLWDMTWEIILQDNQIDANIYETPTSTSAMRGNVAALKLVNEGLRLQPCSPSFVQARDAILQADQTLFNGRYRCAIARAFGRRGLGANATTGSSSNDRIVSEQYTPITDPSLSSSLSFTICSGSPFAYTATSTTAGLSYGWTRPAIAGIANLSAAAVSTFISETLVNTTTNPILVTYLITLNGGPNPCGTAPVPQRVRVLVNPTLTPVVASYSVCQNGIVPAGEGLVSATALTATTTHTITTGTTYVRPNGDNATTYASSGISVFFRSLTFVSPVSGAVTFGVTAANLSDASADSYMAIYQNAFSPTSPGTNFLRGDDDSGPGFLSQFTQTLTAGTTYVLVLSAYSGSVTGTVGLQTTTPLLPITPNWFTAAAGGTLLATTTVFNPVGVSGSGVPNTATPGNTTFYLANGAFPTCRLPATFSVVPTPTAPTLAGGPTVVAGSSVTLTGSCSTAGSSLRWYVTATNAPVTMPISPTATTQYTARCEQAATSTTCVGPSSTVTVTVLPAATFDSAMSGNWNVPGTWLCNCIPDGTKPVRILNTHIVTVPNAFTGQTKGVTFVGSGQLSVQGSGKVNMQN